MGESLSNNAPKAGDKTVSGKLLVVTFVVSVASLSASSVAVAVNTYSSPLSRLGRLQDQRPELSAVTVHVLSPRVVTTTMAPGSLTPNTNGLFGEISALKTGSVISTSRSATVISSFAIAIFPLEASDSTLIG